MLKQRESIAIVGIGCRTPGGVLNQNDFWTLLLNNVDGITPIPEERWNIDEYYDPDPNKTGKMKMCRAGFINGMDKFDNEFFNIFPTEAENIDPQQRLLLQTTFEALEDSGDTLDIFRGSKTAVYVGAFANDYQDILADPDNRYRISPQSTMGTSLTSLANRISYLYDLKGPSISLDTACSSSLVAVHLACQSIWRGEVTQAIAGGVNININPALTIMLSKGSFLSADGACKSFDESGNGYVRSEGVGLIYLKYLSQAVADNNKIYGLIRGTACNSDGYTPAGYTVPSQEAQTIMLQDAYLDADVDVSRVQFIEAHGTGTSVGDPLETQAFANVFAASHSADQPLLLGSVKSNIGHLEGAAGIAGLIKLALCLHHKKIPANLHFKKANPKIDFKNWNLKVVDKQQDWLAPDDGGSRLGGVNSFGAGGTNAHVVIEEYVPDTEIIVGMQEAEDIQPAVSLFTCSAQTEDALKALLASYQDYLANTRINLNDLCFNAGQHRSSLQQRIAIAARGREDLNHKINAFLNGDLLTGVEYGQPRDKKPRLAFVFTGQGPQWYAMGQQLIDTEPVFRHVIQKIENLFQKMAGWSLLEEMSRSEAESRISDTRIAQPAIMALQIALVELWKHNGIEPDGVIGHSIGEVAAAYTAGALTLEQAVQVIYHRSRGQHAAVGKGTMLAVGMPLEEAKALISAITDKVSIAAVNGPESIVLSGDREPLDILAQQLSEKDIFNRFLKVDVSFHSHHMEPLQQALVSSLNDLISTKAKIPLYSTVTGRQENGQHLVSEYWYQNVRDPVYFSPALAEMLKDGFDTFIEIGPHPALSSGAQELFAKLKSNAQIYPSIRRNEDEDLRFKQTLAALSILGQPINWHKVSPGAKRLHDLPRYIWQEKRFWNESINHRQNRLLLRPHPHITHHQDSGVSPNKHTFNIFLDSHADPYLGGHRMDGLIVFPAAGHMELATAAARKAFGDDFNSLTDVSFNMALFLPDDGETPQINLEIDSDECRYWIMSRDRTKKEAQWTKHSNGFMNCLDEKPAPPAISLADIQKDVNNPKSMQPIYTDLERAGLAYDNLFKVIQNLWTAPDKLLAKVVLAESLHYGIEHFLLHPTIFDGALQTIYAMRRLEPGEELGVYLPVHVERYTFFRKPTGAVIWNYLTFKEANQQTLLADIVIFDDITGDVVAEIIGLHMKYITGTRRHEEDVAYSGCYEYHWQPAEALKLEPATGVDVLLIADKNSQYDILAKTLMDNGAHVITLGNISSFNWPVDLENCNTVISAIAEIKSRYPKLNRIINALPKGESGEIDLPVRVETLAWKTLNIHHAIVQNELTVTLWTLTCCSDRVTPQDKQINLVQAPIYGLSRTLNNEYPLATSKIIDFGDNSEQEVRMAVSLIISTNNGGNETELAIRGDNLFVHRLNKIDAAQAQAEGIQPLPASGGYYQAQLAEPTVLSSVQLNRITPAILQPNEVEIAVKAAALNEADALTSQLSKECAGVITRIGSEVTHFSIGEPVIALADAAVAGVVVTPEHCVMNKPVHLTFEQAAAIPLAYLTAYYSLYSLAHIRQGERVLIHTAAWSLGMAAIQLAQRLGAEIFATAATDAQCTLLRAMGVDAVYSSDPRYFHQQIMADTQGSGVDVVLNNLDGKGVIQSFKSLRPLGRFIETNRRNITDDMALQINGFKANLSYFYVDISALIKHRPDEVRSLFTRVIDLFRGLNPLHVLDFIVFPMRHLLTALAESEQAQKMGKIVISMEGDTVNALPDLQLHLNPEKVYLITGGTTGLGIELAKWLVGKGAKKLALISRSGPKTDDDWRIIKELQRQQIEVMLLEADIASSEQVRQVVDQVKNSAPIGGVIHSGAVMQNALVQNLQRDDFLPAFSAKAFGAWNLHQALRDDNLDFFLSISSIAAVFGFGGQSSYAAANSFLDKFTYYRQLHGMSAQAVNLGVLDTFAGLSKNADELLNLLDKQGWLPMSPQQVTAKIERILLEGNVVRMAANVDWGRFREHYEHLRSDRRFAHLLSDEALNIQSKASGNESLREKIESLGTDEAIPVLTQHLVDALARILGTTSDKIETEKSLLSMGLDSLMLNQLRHWVQQKLDINYPLMKMVKGPSLRELAGHIHQALLNNNSPKPQSGDISGISTADDLEIIHQWFVRLKRPEGEPLKKIKLFMMPSMGAGASMFAHFLYNPPLDCEVYALQSPGRENRVNELNHIHLTPLLADLEGTLEKLLTEDKEQYGWEGDLAFFGHSYGGIVMFELYRSLREKGHKLPIHFFASATMTPQLTGMWKKRDSMQASSNMSTSEQKLLSLLTYIDDLEFVKQIIPGMRRDMPLLMSYDYLNGEPLSCPITVFSAIEDEVTLVDEMAQWKAQTTAHFEQLVVHGDHWFISRNKDFIAEKIAEVLG